MEKYSFLPEATEDFNEEEDVYAQINNRDTLYTLTSTDVADSYILSFFNKEGEYS